MCARSGAGGVAGDVGGPAPSGPPALFGSDTPRLPVGIRRSLGGAKPRRECPNAVVCHPVGTSLRVWRLVGAAARGTTGPKGSRSDEGRLYGGSAPEWGAVRCGRGVRLSMTPPRHASAPCPCSRCGAGAAVVVAGVPDAPAAVSGCVGLWRLTGHHRGGSRTAAPLRWRRPRPDLPVDAVCRPEAA